MIATEFTESTEVLSAKNANTFMALPLIEWVNHQMLATDARRTQRLILVLLC